MEDLFQDLHYSVRLLLKSPGFTAVALLALTLGIGANSAIFSVINSSLLRPLPYSDPDRLVMVWGNNPQIQFGYDELPASLADFLDWRNQNEVFESISAFSPLSFNITGGVEPERVGGVSVSSDFFQLLKINPFLGRTFVPEEEQPGKHRVAVLTYNLWQRRFGSDQNIIDKPIMLNGESYTIVGVMPKSFGFPQRVEMPPGFAFTQQTELWTPLAVDPAELEKRGDRGLAVIARLKPGITLQQAQLQMDSIVRALEQQYPEHNSGWGVTIISLHEQIVGKTQTPILMLFGAVGLVLLIACANVANLLLARAVIRRREIVIRAALGATRLRIVRQLLTESTLLSLLGGVLGLLLALWGGDLLLSIGSAGLPRVEKIDLDIWIFGFTLLVSLLTGIIFGLVPALHASRVDLNEMLKEGGRVLTGGQHRTRDMLLVSEVALTLVLLIGAGLLVRSLVRLQQVDIGFEPKNVLTMQIPLTVMKYRDRNQRLNFFQQVLDKVRALPGMQSAGLVSVLPLSGTEASTGITLEGRPLPPGQTEPTVGLRRAAGDYFKAMSIPLLQGRDFTERDTRDAPQVAIINETMAERFWPGESPIGKRVMIQDVWCEVVGIVKNVKHTALENEVKPEAYRPYLQSAGFIMSLVARTDSKPLNMVQAVRSQIGSVDADQPVAYVATMEQIVTASVAQRRFNMMLLVIFSAVALLLATMGIYGVTSYVIVQRTHEIGLRLALGAQSKDIFKMIIMRGMIPILIGLAIGLVGAFVVTRMMSSLIFGISAIDPVTFAVVPVLLTGVALLANFIPARKAMRKDPMITLRYE